MAAPFRKLEYLYVGTSDFERDLAYYRDVLKAELVWNLTGFGAHVAAFKVGLGPLLLIADHRPAPSCMPVYAVEDLNAAVRALKKRGWKPHGGRMRDSYRASGPIGDAAEGRLANYSHVDCYHYF